MTVVKIILPRPLLFFFFYIIISRPLKLEDRVTESHIDHRTPLLQEPETVENSHSISMTPPTNLATVIALVMLTALSPALGAGTSTSSVKTHACVSVCVCDALF